MVDACQRQDFVDRSERSGKNSGTCLDDTIVLLCKPTENKGFILVNVAESCASASARACDVNYEGEEYHCFKSGGLLQLTPSRNAPSARSHMAQCRCSWRRPPLQLAPCKIEWSLVLRYHASRAPGKLVGLPTSLES